MFYIPHFSFFTVPIACSTVVILLLVTFIHNALVLWRMSSLYGLQWLTATGSTHLTVNRRYKNTVDYFDCKVQPSRVMKDSSFALTVDIVSLKL